MYSLIIKNGRILDGLGHVELKSDIAIEGDKIVAIAPSITSQAHTIIDAHGQIVSPGFIDIQNHSDTHWQLFDNPGLHSMVAQGYTSILIGNSGASLAPLLSPQSLLALQKWHTLQGVNIDWRSFSEFAQTLRKRTYGCNIGSMIGYSTLRRGLIGDRLTPLSKVELTTLSNLIAQALTEGAFGVSTGLSYAHEVIISDIELFEIAKVVASHNSLLSIHLRDEGSRVVDAVREVIAIASQSQVNLKIAHLKIRNRTNWPLVSEVLDELETAWHQGVKLHFDVYPYTSTWQALYTYLPTWAIQGGRKHLLVELRNPVQRNKIIAWLNNSDTVIKDLRIASTSNNLHASGKSLSAIAADMGTSSEEAMLKLIENGGSEVLVFDECLSAENVQTLTAHALGVIATNGSGYQAGTQAKLVHPRCFGTAPRFLRSMIDTQLISLPEAIRKLTSAPAEIMGLTNRGTVAVGAFADLVIFDPEHIADTTTVNNPMQYPTGISTVIVNGTPTLFNGSFTSQISGVFLTRS